MLLGLGARGRVQHKCHSSAGYQDQDSKGIAKPVFGRGVGRSHRA